jgi:phytoene dehydrogenase-like protein
MLPGVMECLDAVIVGGGHNGLVAAILLARAGWRVRVLERLEQPGGAAVSAEPFEGVGARLSRYSYLVSLLGPELRRELGLRVQLRRRAASWCADDLLVGADEDAGPEYAAWQALVTRAARALRPTLLEPLRPREELLAMIEPAAREALFEAPLALSLERALPCEPVRGVVATDALIGTFASLAEASLRQNRCFLYHVIGGCWDVPVGGMGALGGELAALARAAGAELACGAEVSAIDADGAGAEVRCADGSRSRARHVLGGVAPAVLERLLGMAGAVSGGAAPRPEGSQLKVNMLLGRLPRLRHGVAPERAFAGTLHVNERCDQLERAYAAAAAGRIPSPAPCELYCHSLTDPSILSPQLRAAGAQTLTVFALHMPARLFAADHEAAKREALAAVVASIDSALAEPLSELLWRSADGRPCLEALTPVELERELAMPGGHIFHRDLSWPFAESAAEIGRWGVETALPNVWLCGAGARRGGGVSGIPGHNAARAVLAAG